MEKLLNSLIKLLDEEIEDLRLGHPFNKDRISYMRSIITIFVYLNYAILNDLETYKLLQIYEHS
jgi:hypothetical protein